MDYLDIARQVIAENESRPAPDPDLPQAVEAVLDGHAVLLASDLLGESVWIVSDEESARKLVSQGERRGSIYTREEIRVVTLIDDPDVVRDVHRVKRIFDEGRLRCEHAPASRTGRGTAK